MNCLRTPALLTCFCLFVTAAVVVINIVIVVIIAEGQLCTLAAPVLSHQLLFDRHMMSVQLLHTEFNALKQSELRPVFIFLLSFRDLRSYK